MLARTASSYRRKGDEGSAEDKGEDIAGAWGAEDEDEGIGGGAGDDGEDTGGGADDDDEGMGGGADDDDEGRGPEGEEGEDESVRVGAGKINVWKSVCLPLCFPDSRKVTLSSASRLRRDEVTWRKTGICERAWKLLGQCRTRRVEEPRRGYEIGVEAQPLRRRAQGGRYGR